MSQGEHHAILQRSSFGDGAPMIARLPPALMRRLPDAQIEVVSWSAASGELVLWVRKEIGPESGLLRFGGVGIVYLPPRFTIASLVAIHRGGEDTLFEIAEAWGESYMVAASWVPYDQDAESHWRPPPV